MNVVFHTAAFKHVILCERSPFEAVQTNILGIQNLISAAIQSKVDQVIFTSSDKAVNPTNVMGTSKLMGEKTYHSRQQQCQGPQSDFFIHPFRKCFGFERIGYSDLS